MQSYVVLIRGINVGGKNKVPMARLRELLEAEGLEEVTTYIASGNVLLSSADSAAAVKRIVEQVLAVHFPTEDSIPIQAHVLSRKELAAVVKHKPHGFGEHPGLYHSDVIFLIGLISKDVMQHFSPREGVDMVWPGDGVIYSQRLSAERTKSRLSKIAAAPVYKQMTIRSWNTTIKLLQLLEAGKV